MANTIEFNPLIVIAAAAVVCAIISFVVARRNITRGRVFITVNGRSTAGDETPKLVDVYIEPWANTGAEKQGTKWKEIMPISASIPHESASASHTTSPVDIAVAILMPSPTKRPNHDSSLNDHGRPSSSHSNMNAKEKETLREQWTEHSLDSIPPDYSIGLIQVSCHHRNPLEFG